MREVLRLTSRERELCFQHPRETESDGSYDRLASLKSAENCPPTRPHGRLVLTLIGDNLHRRENYP